MFLFTARRINAVEAFKHTLPQRTRYPGTVVGDDQRNTAAPLGCRKLDFAAGRRICDRVVQQDGHRLPDALAVTIAFWKGIVGKGNMDADLFLRRSWFVPFSGVEQQGFQICFLADNGPGAAVRTGKR